MWQKCKKWLYRLFKREPKRLTPEEIDRELATEIKQEILVHAKLLKEQGVDIKDNVLGASENKN